LGYDEYGHQLFDTTYTEVGDLLYRLKYRGDLSIKDELVETIVNFIKSWNPPVDIIVPVPPTRSDRKVQPVIILSEAIGSKLGISVLPKCIRKVKGISELKDVYDFNKRHELLSGAYEVQSQPLINKRVLLFDDLYRSGATMNTIAELLYNKGKVADVYALTVTRTRSRR